MSGGSFNYLCFTEAAEAFAKRSTMSEMQVALEDAGYIEAALATKKLRHELNRIELEIQTKLNGLQAIWRAMEWYSSGDISKNELAKVAAEYKRSL